MRYTSNIFKAVLGALFLLPLASMAQFTDSIAYMRYYDQRGLNVFETPKTTSIQYTGMKVRFGAGFTQQFQNLKHENNSDKYPDNKLYAMSAGFNTASANLFMDVALADGIRLNLTTYLSSRHHNDTWVKGGYIQFDKLPFKGEFWDKLMDVATIKIGHMEINYGDQHFRRSDGGQTLYNPFAENYIMDGYTTEIGGEIYLQKNGFMGMLGITNGMIKGNIDSLVATTQDDNVHKSPSIYLKGAFDRQVADNVRLRLAASYYHNGSSGANTLYGGDRTGSNYFMVMEKAGDGVTYATNAFSGRVNPGFTKKIDAVQLNGFLNVGGFELFGTYETASGRSKTEVDTRTANQIAVDAIYRFGPSKNLFIGGRYNTVAAELAGFTDKVHVNRVAGAAGWYLTKNVLLKGEIVNQEYKDYPDADYRNSGKFHGYVIEAVVGF